MPIERTHFVVKFPEDAPSSLLSLFPSPNGKYVSVRATNPKQNISMPVNTVLYPHNGQYVPVQWKVNNDFTHIQLYWWPHNRVYRSTSPTTQLRSGKEIYIIRTLFSTLFWCIIKFKLSLNRVRIRLLIKKAMIRNSLPNKLSLFSGNVNYPIQRRILECI